MYSRHPQIYKQGKQGVQNRLEMLFYLCIVKVREGTEDYLLDLAVANKVLPMISERPYQAPGAGADGSVRHTVALSTVFHGALSSRVGTPKDGSAKARHIAI